MEERSKSYENAIREMDAQIRALLLDRMSLAYRLYHERGAQGQQVWDITKDTALLAEVTAGLPRPQAEMMREIWSIILREERKQYFLDRRSRP